MANPNDVKKLIEDAGGTVDEMGLLPDGSGFATASFPLPKDHWLYEPAKDGFDAPPMPLRMGTSHPLREGLAEATRSAARYAVRAATMRGAEADFDPDALVLNMVVGLLGYWTPDGTSDDSWANPTPLPVVYQAEPHVRNSDLIFLLGCAFVAGLFACAWAFLMFVRCSCPT